MKSTGIVRRVDELGRIVLPKELRNVLEIKGRVPGKTDGDSLEIYIEGEQIILKKYAPACVFCGEAKDVRSFKGKNICKGCMKELSK